MYRSVESKGRRVLVVDDELTMRELLSTRLAIAGYDAHEAKDGYEALARLPDLRPSVLILDINMPRMDGFEVLENLRGRDYASGIRIMVLTARNHTADVRRAVALGAHDYLAKPFKDLQFLARMARLLRVAT